MRTAGPDTAYQGGQVIVKKETVARFILGEDGALPRGVPAGTPDSPDSLPHNDHVLTGPWTRGTRPSGDQPAGENPVVTVLSGRARSSQELLARQGIVAGIRLPAADIAAVVPASGASFETTRRAVGG